jgi:hypothetical protein
MAGCCCVLLGADWALSAHRAFAVLTRHATADFDRVAPRYRHIPFTSRAALTSPAAREVAIRNALSTCDTAAPMSSSSDRLMVTYVLPITSTPISPCPQHTEGELHIYDHLPSKSKVKSTHHSLLYWTGEPITIVHTSK